MTRFSDIAATLSRAGYRPIPIKPRDKAPAVAGWTDYAFIDADRQRFADAGVGLLCGELRAIDIDVRNEEVSTRLSQLAAQMLWPGSKAPRRIGQWPKTLFMVRHFGSDQKIDAQFKAWGGNGLKLFPPKEGEAAIAALDELVSVYKANFEEFAKKARTRLAAKK